MGVACSFRCHGHSLLIVAAPSRRLALRSQRYICIGSYFALTEAHLLLVTLPRNHDLTRASSAPYAACPLLCCPPDGPIHVTVRRRSPVPA